MTKKVNMCVYFQWQGMDCINEKEPVCLGAHIVASLSIHCQLVCASHRHMFHGKKSIYIYIYPPLKRDIYISMKHVPVVPLFNVKNSCRGCYISALFNTLNFDKINTCCPLCIVLTFSCTAEITRVILCKAV